jgi:hypothetical protein
MHSAGLKVAYPLCGLSPTVELAFERRAIYLRGVKLRKATPMNALTGRKLRVKLRRYSQSEVYILEIATPRGWSSHKEFVCHETCRAYLYAHQVSVELLNVHL